MTSSAPTCRPPKTWASTSCAATSRSTTRATTTGVTSSASCACTTFPAASIYTPKARANWELHLPRRIRARLLPSLHLLLDPLQRDLGPGRAPDACLAGSGSKTCTTCANSSIRTRLVEDNSAVPLRPRHHDINTWHFYIGDYDRARRHVERVVEQTYEGSPYQLRRRPVSPMMVAPTTSSRAPSPC